MKFTLPYRLALGYLALSLWITISWFWQPFNGASLLRVLAPVVRWNHLDVGKAVYYALHDLLKVTPSFETFAVVSTILYALCFIILGTIQWFGLGLLLQVGWQRLRRARTS